MVCSDYARRSYQYWASVRYVGTERVPFGSVRSWQALLKRVSECRKVLHTMEVRGIDFEPVSIEVARLRDISDGGRRDRTFPEAKSALRASAKRIAEHLYELWVEDNRARAKERSR